MSNSTVRFDRDNGLTVDVITSNDGSPIDNPELAILNQRVLNITTSISQSTNSLSQEESRIANLKNQLDNLASVTSLVITDGVVTATNPTTGNSVQVVTKAELDALASTI